MSFEIRINFELSIKLLKIQKQVLNFLILVEIKLWLNKILQKLKLIFQKLNPTLQLFFKYLKSWVIWITKLKKYILKRLEKNEITKICRFEGNANPEICALLKKCQPTSATIEPSFSNLKHLKKSDQHFLNLNLKDYLICIFMVCSAIILKSKDFAH